MNCRESNKSKKGDKDGVNICLYKKIGDFIHDQIIQFSNDFEVHLENKILTVREKKNYLKDFYGDGIKNISVFVGKKGA